MRKPRTRHRDAGTGEFVSADYADANRATTVAEGSRQAPSGAAEVTFKKGDLIEHPAVGKATVTSGKLGPEGELKVRPVEPHHSGKKVVEVMARRCTLLQEKD